MELIEFLALVENSPHIKEAGTCTFGGAPSYFVITNDGRTNSYAVSEESHMTELEEAINEAGSVVSDLTGSNWLYEENDNIETLYKAAPGT